MAKFNKAVNTEKNTNEETKITETTQLSLDTIVEPAEELTQPLTEIKLEEKVVEASKVNEQPKKKSTKKKEDNSSLADFLF